MNNDILLWANVDIMNALEKWGVLTIRNLHNLLCSKITIRALRRKVHNLAKADYLQISRLDSNNEMIIIPTKKSLNQLKSNRTIIDESMIYHNLFISLLGHELTTRQNVTFYNLPHEYRKSRTPVTLGSAIEPDAYIGLKHNDKISKVALEVELTQKSSDRVFEKFKQYKDSLYFDYVIYFFQSESILNAYKRRLNEFVNEFKLDIDRNQITGKIIFLYSDQNHQYGSILENSSIECQNRAISIDKFFGSTNKI